MNREQFLKQFGPWAVVTGASSGIGKGYAEQLAAAGLNLILVARREQVLQKLGTELKRQHKIAFRVVSADLTTTEGIEAVRAISAELNPSLLVANAGAAAMGAFNRIPAAKLNSMLQLNVIAPMELAHAHSSRLLENGQKGGIIFVSSMAGLQGTPLGGNYAGAKAYVLNLGESLNYELRDTGIHVSVLVPGPTDTPALTHRDDVDLTTIPMPPMSVESVVHESLRALAKNKAVCFPGVMNKMMAGPMGKRMLSRKMNVAMWGMLMQRATPDALKVSAGQPKLAIDSQVT